MQLINISTNNSAGSFSRLDILRLDLIRFKDFFLDTVTTPEGLLVGSGCLGNLGGRPGGLFWK
jgi:hypothetical protein